MVIKSCTPEEMASPWLPLVLALMRVHSAEDSVAYFRLLRACPYVLACVLATQANDMRLAGFRMAFAAYGGWRGGWRVWG